jgi:hypothetical protein
MDARNLRSPGAPFRIQVQNPRKKRAYYYFSLVDKAPGIKTV